MPSRSRFVSLEFFPPKEHNAWQGFESQIERMAELAPLFVSVTYGAGGGTRATTLATASCLQERFGLFPMVHLTCAGATHESIVSFMEELQDIGITNILALRGDLPPGVLPTANSGFSHASDLVAFIRLRYPETGIAVACYPEAHPEAASIADDLEWTKHKLDVGADFAITQLFFDVRCYNDFVARLRRRGVVKPIIPGVLPLLSMQSLHRILSLCGASIPVKLYLELVQADKDGGNEAVRRKGIEIAQRQIRDLIEQGASGIHLYTLNNADACIDILSGVDYFDTQKKISSPSHEVVT